MAKGKKGFLIFHDQETVVQELSDENAGRILKALFRYSADSEETHFKEPEVRMAYKIFCASLDRNAEEYQAICDKRSASAKKRYEKTSERRSSNYTSGTDQSSSGHNKTSEKYPTEFDEFLKQSRT